MCELVYLVQRDWSHLREEYPSLNAAQLHFVLVHYAFTEGRVRPAGWVPPAEELKDATNNGESLSGDPTQCCY